MIRDLFEIPKSKDELKHGQKQWLEMVSRIAEVKTLMGGTVCEADIAVSNEAKEILEQLA